MNWLDMVIIVCIVIGIIHGLTTGIVKQIISLISLVAAILLSRTVAHWIRQWIQPHLHGESNWFSPVIQNAVFYILAFILIIVVFAFAAKLIDEILHFTPAGMINRLFGAIFGMSMWVLCLSIVFNFFAVFDSKSRLLTKPLKENSAYYEKVKMIFPTVFPYIKDFFKEGLHE